MQNLLFPEERNFHLQCIGGRPVGSMSLRQYAWARVKEDGPVIWTDNNGQLHTMTEAESYREHIYAQQALMRAHRKGLTGDRPFWWKQRIYYRRFLEAMRGDDLTTMVARK